MLTARIGQSPEVEIVGIPSEKRKLIRFSDDHAVLSAGSEISADYVINGVITVFGESTSTDAKLLHVPDGKVLLEFHETGQKKGDVLHLVGRFADRVKGWFDEHHMDTSTKMVIPETHPSAEKTVPVSGKSKSAASGLNESQTEKTREETTPPERKREIIWESRAFKGEIRCLDIGDIDGNHRDELVCATSNRLHAYRFENGRLVKFGQIVEHSSISLIGIDIADIDLDGRSEVFVTAHDNAGALTSFVVKWDGKKLRKTEENQNLYYRVMRPTEKNSILFGQKRSVLSGSGNFDETPFAGLFFQKVFEIKWMAGSFQAGERLVLPKRVNIFEFVLGDILNDGDTETITIDENGHIRIYKKAKRIWKSEKSFGGGITSLEYPSGDDHKRKERYYVPQRMIISDIDGDGKNELIVIRNHEIARGLLQRLKSYDIGRVEVYAWNGEDLELRGKTKDLDDYICDIAVGDLSGKGKKEIVFSVAGNAGIIPGILKSVIYSWLPGKMKTKGGDN